MNETLPLRRVLPAALAATALALIGALTFSAAAHADIRLQPVRSLDASEGRGVPSERIVVFDDAGACAPGAYTVEINWGDGTTSPAQITFTDAILDTHLDPIRCTYQAVGEHAYRTGGVMALSARVCRGAECRESGAGGAARVSEAPLRGDARSFNAAAGVAYTGEVARFEDENPLAQASDYTATVDWGDGSTSAGTVTRDGGRFSVAATHTYAAAGRLPVRVTVSEAGTTRLVLDGATASVDDDRSGSAGDASQGGGAAPVTQSSRSFRPTLRLRARTLRRGALRRGLPIRVSVAQATRSLRIELVRVAARPRVLGTISVRVAGGRVQNGVRTVDLRVRFSAALRRKIRAGSHALRFRLPGSGTVSAQFRITR